jgi:NitT/TauT family transport system ATP-binding protein
LSGATAKWKNKFIVEKAISLTQITKIFQDTPGKETVALKHINLEIFAGEFFVILGPSGSGKSTLLRVMSGLEKPSEGSVEFGAGVKKPDISFVFQQFAVLPWLTVYQNVELGLLAKEFSENDRNRAVTAELKQLRLEKFADSYSKELSGGMRQRVGLARALIINPKIIFMDEPFSELDSFTAEELRKELLRVWRERKLTIVMVTHLIQEALELADRIAVLTPLPGKIEKILVNFLPRPRDKRSQEFYGLEDELYKLIKP